MDSAINFTKPDPLAATCCSRLDFIMTLGMRLRCSCGKDYHANLTEGGLANLMECNHHPDWYYLHVLRFPDETIIVWECCKERILTMMLDDTIPPELKIAWNGTYDDLVRERLKKQAPSWLVEMSRAFFFYDSGFSRNPISTVRP